uniref:Uncharacterized protein n=1 Tax=Prymnesium polylepis TaxID=72548 RepID=A0A6V4A7K5_9EUKA|mmetsp:Transcript_2038/g.4373  ORF Transcript_2038/g.4373 Transcript_2038/m.4373 type:complete len:269 (+) Transcript_2038:11-817(+)
MKTVMEVAAHAAPDATGDDVKKEDESTPPWLQSAVDRLAAEMVTERNGGAVDAAGVVTDVSVGQRATRSWLLLLVAPVVVAASIAVALFAIRTPGPESTASASGFSAALAVQGVSANHEQQMLGALSSALGTTLKEAVSRGDGAVLAASREAAAREAAQAKLAQLERVVSRLRRELAVARSSIKEYTERVRAKEEALSRLEDVHSLTSQQLEKDSACCRTESRASGQAREAQEQAQGRLYRCEQQLERVAQRTAPKVPAGKNYFGRFG